MMNTWYRGWMRWRSRDTAMGGTAMVEGKGWGQAGDLVWMVVLIGALWTGLLLLWR